MIWYSRGLYFRWLRDMIRWTKGCDIATQLSLLEDLNLLIPTALIFRNCFLKEEKRFLLPLLRRKFQIPTGSTHLPFLIRLSNQKKALWHERCTYFFPHLCFNCYHWYGRHWNQTNRAKPLPDGLIFSDTKLTYKMVRGNDATDL